MIVADFTHIVRAAGPDVVRLGAAALLVERSRTVGHLAAHLGRSNSSMTQLLDTMERLGWIIRTVGAGDRRERIVELTDLGRRQLNLLRARIEEGGAA